ncbi:uncharacterized protein [Castor canadensis]|uniref:Uncharacterized protein n=1 Tax=Castor canadensis TaxID=51338 RepID=A0AC58KV23_CASCN
MYMKILQKSFSPAQPFSSTALHLTYSSGSARQQRTPPGACFKYNQTGHWAKHCPSPRPPPGPCPQCGQNGHWKDDCPSLSLQDASRIIQGTQQTDLPPDATTTFSQQLALSANEAWDKPSASTPGDLTNFQIPAEPPLMMPPFSKKQLDRLAPIIPTKGCNIRLQNSGTSVTQLASHVDLFHLVITDNQRPETLPPPWLGLSYKAHYSTHQVAAP